MPPRKRKTPAPQQISTGAGITAGLELWLNGTTFLLRDRTADNRFASDVTTWSAAANLNASDLQAFKDATDTTRSR
jgi:hypothetical protein